MLAGRKRQIAGGAFLLALALALWGCVGTIDPSLTTKPTLPVFAIQPARIRHQIGDVFRDGDGNGAARYQWQKNNANISGATSSTHTPGNSFRRQWRPSA
jgi:hypothetical protein